MSILAYSPEQLEHLNSDAAFERRMEGHRARWIGKHEGQVWHCSNCGERFGAAYRYEYSTCCECDGDLEAA